MSSKFTIALGAASAAWLIRVRRERKRAERLAAATLETLLNAIDANDPQTGAHVRRVARYALILADAAGLDERRCHSVERIALFHDIGKIHEALFDILRERTKLSPEEREEMETHPRRGAEVLDPVSAFYPDLGRGVLAHHEQWDGSGYPRGLKGKQIPLAARIVAIADSFDAITQRRPYREGASGTTAARKIAAGRGTQFDPDLVDLFLSRPVFNKVCSALRESNRPRIVSGGRRHAEHPGAPDVPFRWRTSVSQAAATHT